jgi:sugar transferase (PEP-CTERM/EpsH1 system associated)
MIAYTFDHSIGQATYFCCPMKLLFVANRVPYPPYRGDKLKIWNLAGRLSKQNELHLITIAQSKEELSYAKELKEVFDSVEIYYLPKWVSFMNTFLAIFSKVPFQVAYFRSGGFRRKIQNLLASNTFDAIHVQHLRMAQYFDGGVPANAILDLPDAFSLYWKRRADNAKRSWMRFFANLEYKRLLRYEKKVLPEFTLNLVCSPEDRDYLKNLSGAEFDVLPNGVDTSVFHPRENTVAEPFRVLFTGNMDYEPNVDAVEYFVDQIWPGVLEAVPQARFVIAGQRPVGRVQKLAGKTVEVTGFVASMADEYAKARLVVAPLRFGAGTQNKVLEALAMGVPVVCSTVGFKGLGIKSGDGAVLAETAADFTKQVVDILSSEEKWQKLSGSGATVISSRFSWDAVSAMLQNFFAQRKA